MATMQSLASSLPASTSATNLPEYEATLSQLAANKYILGYLLLTRQHPVSIIRSSGAIFEGEHGRKYAVVISRIVESVRSGLEDVQAEGSDQDDVEFLRIRTKRHGILITPDEKHILAIVHDPMS